MESPSGVASKRLASGPTRLTVVDLPASLNLRLAHTLQSMINTVDGLKADWHLRGLDPEAVRLIALYGLQVRR